jgi:hypothetical protein
MLALEACIERSGFVLLANSDRILDEQRNAAHRVGLELLEPV